MNCPECHSSRVIVINSRRKASYRGRKSAYLIEKRYLKGNVIVRVRRCLTCLTDWWTVEKTVHIIKEEDGIEEELALSAR